MPLEQSSSKGAFSRNVSTLMGEIGNSPHVKDRKQALAIAYSTQRRNRAGGGNLSAFQDEMGAMGLMGSMGGPGGGMVGMGGLPQNIQSRIPSGYNSGLSQNIESRLPPQIANILDSARSKYNDKVAPLFDRIEGNTQGNPGLQTSPQWQTQGTSPFSNTMPGFSPPFQLHNSYQPVIQPPIGGSMGIAPLNPAAPSINQNQGTSSGSDLVTAMQGIARKVNTGGGIENRAYGGFNMAKAPSLNPSYQNKMEMRGVMHTGPVLSNVPGRTDHHSTHVPSGSYVLPADHVSSMGQGNTLAGVQTLDKMFRQGPYGTSLPHLGHGRGIPRGPRLSTAHSGGGKGVSSNVGAPTGVNIAGGEYVITPEAIMETVHPDLDTGHRILDSWVIQNRKNHIKTLKGLPGPAKD